MFDDSYTGTGPASSSHNAPVRLLFVLPELKPGGAQRATLALLAELDQQRYQSTLLVLGGPGDALQAVVPSGVRLVFPPLWLRRGIHAARWVTWWAARNHDLLIGALEMRASFAVAWASRRRGIPSILWVHTVFDAWAVGMGAKHRRRCNAVYREIDDVVFVSQGALDGMARWLGHRGLGWRVLPNVLSPSLYAAGADSHVLRARVFGGSTPRRPVILGIGRLVPLKGFDLLIRAFALACREGVEADLVLLGEGRERSRLSELARAEGVENRVHMPGHVPDPLNWLRYARLYALSSRVEGLSMTILEAMHMGVPVVATDCPTGPRELLKNGAIGRLVPMEDSRAMADAIRVLIADGPEREDAIRDGRSRAHDYAPDPVRRGWALAFNDAMTRAGKVSV